MQKKKERKLTAIGMAVERTFNQINGENNGAIKRKEKGN